MSFIHTLLDGLDAAPERPAVTEVHGDRLVPTSAGDLARLVAAARAALRALGVTPGDRVVLLAPNSARWVAADLAVLAEGAVCVPMYARQDPDELVAMMHDAEPRAVLCADDRLLDAVTSRWASAPATLLATLFAPPDAAAPLAPVVAPPAPRDPDAPATIIYTSGTSGEPKGVILSTANVDFMLPVVTAAIEAMMGPDRPDHRVFHYLPFCFAGSRVVLWMCLFRRGGVMVSTNLDDLATELRAARPNYVLNVPALLDRIRAGVEAKLAERPLPIRALWSRGKRAAARAKDGRASLVDRATLALARRLVFAKIRAQIGPELACLICGSAPLGVDTQRWFETLGLPVYQVYGLTETTAIVTMDTPGQVEAGRVGRAIAGVETRLGEGDELLVRGPNIFAGYWRKDDATAAAFADGGWFRTGDQVERDADGNTRVIGRVKDLLVPSSGHNVAPEPIEQRLVEGLPGVEQAVVIGHGRPHLTAILCGDADRAAVDAALVDVNAALPHYRRVRAFHLTPERLTPESGLLTANQKLRRAAIAAHFADAIEAMYAGAPK